LKCYTYDGAEIKREFPNSKEARQNFITKQDIVSISIYNILSLYWRVS